MTEKEIHEKKISDLEPPEYNCEHTPMDTTSICTICLKKWAIAKVNHWKTLIPKEIKWWIVSGAIHFDKAKVENYYHHRILAKMGAFIQEFELTKEDLK